MGSSQENAVHPIKFNRATFTPSEAAAITGLDVMTQRNLRRHGYLPQAAKGWTRHSVDDVAKLLLMGVLDKLGLPPSGSSVIAEAHHDKHKQSTAELIGAVACNNPCAICDPEGLAHQVKLLDLEIPRYLVVREIEGFSFEGSLQSIEKRSDSAAAIVVELPRLAELIVERAGKPLVTVARYLD
jgi:hypothetical protein